MIGLSIWLYGKPNWDLDIEGKDCFDPNMFREQGDVLRTHLYCVASVLKKLHESGWRVAECYGTLYSIELYKEGVTWDEAKRELTTLGIDHEFICMEELEAEMM